MLPPHSFPLSPVSVKRVLVIASAGAYIALSGDRRLPGHFILLFAITVLSAWGIRAKYRWAWVLATLFSAWQIYSGIGILLPLLSADMFHAPLPARIIFGVVALRTLVLAAVFLLLLFFSDRKNVFG
jgi:hypothetical protein